MARTVPHSTYFSKRKKKKEEKKKVQRIGITLNFMSPSEGREKGRKWGGTEARDDVGIPQLPFGYYYCSLLEHGVLRGKEVQTFRRHSISITCSNQTCNAAQL